MGQEQVLDALVNLGLTRTDAQVYLYLSKQGLQRGRAISTALNLTKQKLYRSLKNLQNQGLVSATLEYPSRFLAVPFEKALDLFIKTKHEEAQQIQQTKNTLISKWQSLTIKQKNNPAASFMIITGRNYIYSKIHQLMQDAKQTLLAVSSVSGLIRVDQLGLLSKELTTTVKPQIKFRFLTELSRQNLAAATAFCQGMRNSQVAFEGRCPCLDLRSFPRLIIKDDDELMFFINAETDIAATEQDAVCLWTNCKSMVQAFTTIFEELWQTAPDIKQKLAHTHYNTKQ